jgi:hypothetical protein
VATIATLADRLRSELGDIPKSFVYQFTADGTTNRFLVPYSPLDGANLVINQGNTDVSSDVEVEEQTGYLVFDTVPDEGDLVIVAGNYFRYFTTAETQQYISTAFLQHSAYHTDAYGRDVSIQNLPALEEYPVILYASTLALYTLANDAAFDINVFAPDGVTIPRSERYQQLMQMIESRKQQYKELCSQLGIGLYKIDVFSFRRISKTTNRYVPIFRPKEIDDMSVANRIRIPIPTYGDTDPPVTTIVQDLYVYEGDDFEWSILLDIEITDYEAVAQVRVLPGAAQLLTEFTITKPDVGSADGEGLRTLNLSLTEEQTRILPGTSYYDVQMTSPDGVTKTYVSGGIFKTSEVTQ